MDVLHQDSLVLEHITFNFQVQAVVPRRRTPTQLRLSGFLQNAGWITRSLGTLPQGNYTALPSTKNVAFVMPKWNLPQPSDMLHSTFPLSRMGTQHYMGRMQQAHAASHLLSVAARTLCIRAGAPIHCSGKIEGTLLDYNSTRPSHQDQWSRIMANAWLKCSRQHVKSLMYHKTLCCF